MLNHCLLHIGTEKTGTTSIQKFFSQNRGRLSDAGFIYPAAPGATSHLGLACLAMDDHRIDRVRTLNAIARPDQVPGFRESLVSRLDREFRRARIHTAIFSSEHLSSKIRSDTEFRRVKQLCARYAHRTTVIVYIRNQTDFLCSRYLGGIKAGSTGEFPFPVPAGAAALMDYAALLARWRDAFGAENLVVRRFEPEDFVGGELIVDITSIVGLDITGMEPVMPQNVALDAPCTAFLRGFNKYIPSTIDGRRNPLHRDVVDTLHRLSTGRPFRIAPAIAAEIDRQFRESNLAVSEAYFGSRLDPLFGRPLTVASADVPCDYELTADESIWIAAELSRSIRTRTRKSHRGDDTRNPACEISEGRWNSLIQRLYSLASRQNV